MSMSVGPAGGEDDVMVEMNTTPLIDVMLVLLVMLIITIPIQTHAVKLDLPQQQQNPAQPPPTYYTVRITLPAAEVARLKDIRLVPGMPVEAFIQTHERTPLQYLLKPLRDQIARTFRER